jgi:hypothetical protein
MKISFSDLAPFLSLNELKALSCTTLPFDAVAFYIRVFCYLDAKKEKPVVVTCKAMTHLNGFVANSFFQPMREARRRTLVKHLERVGLIDKPITDTKLNFERVYTRLLSDELTAINEYEYQRLVDVSLSYEALSLYVRAIRPNLNTHTFKAVVSDDTVNQALTFTPIYGSSEKFVSWTKLITTVLTELQNVGLIEYIYDDHLYCFTCHVSNGFNSNWLKSLGETT